MHNLINIVFDKLIFAFSQELIWILTFVRYYYIYSKILLEMLCFATKTGEAKTGCFDTKTGEAKTLFSHFFLFSTHERSILNIIVLNLKFIV